MRSPWDAGDLVHDGEAPRSFGTLEEALAAMGGADVDLLLCAAVPPTSEHLPPAPAVLDSVGNALGVISDAGELLWANAAMNRLPAEARGVIVAAAAEALRAAAAGEAEIRTVKAGREEMYDLLVARVADAAGGAGRAVVSAWDRSATRRQQERISTIDAAGRELVQLETDSDQLDLVERLRLLEEKTLRLCHELLRFDHLVVRVIDQRSGKLETVIAGGLSEEARSLEIRVDPERGGISGYVAATGRSVLCDDVRNEPRYLPGLEEARSSLTVPLRLNEQIIGTLNVESDEVGAFSDEDRIFAEIIGRYIAIALHMLQLLAVERSAATGQLAADVNAELAAPVSEIVADAERLLAEPGAPRELAESIIRNARRLRESVRAVAESPPMVGLASWVPVRHAALAGKRILVADDEDIIRENIADVLSEAGAVVTRARDGAEAIAIIGVHTFDLVLSDIKMPHKNGYEVFSAVRRSQPDCPVILITGFGYDPNHAIVRASKEGLAGVLFKPFKVEQLMEDVERALSASSTPG